MTAVLVLLVIIAIAFLSQSSGGRVTAVSTQSSSILDDRSSAIAEDVARQVAEALFTRPIDPTDPDVVAGNEANANYPRGPFDLAAVRYGANGRYGVDPQDFNDPYDFDADGNLNEPDGFPDFSYNFAPYETVPWTNWPSLLFRTDDAPGGPGFGDARWLRDTEPNRLVEQGIGYQFSHWQHLTYLPTAENGWRVVADLSDVTGSLATDLRVPLEQWPPEIASQLAANPNLLLPVPGAVQTTFVNQFLARRDGWFFDYASVYANASSVLPNLWDLKLLGPPSDEFKPGTKRNVVSRTFADTDGDGITDAFWMLAPSSIDQKLRQVVAVSIVDNGGLVNVNAATRFVRRNANEAVVAGALVPYTATTGASPADVALVTAEEGVTRTGLLDNPLNQQGVLFGPGALVDFSYDTDLNFKVRFDPQRWSDADDGYTFLDEAGVLGNGLVNTYALAAAAYLTPNPFLAPAADRLRYWKAGAMRPYGDPGLAVTPFGTPEEIELRLFNGQNMPAVLSRLERSLNLSQANDYQLLRSNMQKREESNEFLDQLNTQELLFDTRRKLTTLNGTMNDVMPAALWPSAYPPTIGATDAGYLAAYDLVEYNKVTKRFSVPAIPNNAGQQDAIVLGSDAITTEDQVRWGQLIRKYDLRAYAPDPRLMRDLDGNGVIQEQGGSLGSNGVNDFDAQATEQRTMARDHLRRILDRSLVSEGPNATLSYFGKGSDAAKKTRSLIASLGANIESFGDGLSLVFGSNPTIAPLPVDRPLSYDDARVFEDPSNPGRRFIGVERQPFIMEAVIAHVYSKGEVPASYPGPLHPDDVTAGTRIRIPLGQPDEGEFFVNSESDVHTVVVVQIANPFDRPLVLATRPLAGGPEVPEYRLRVFGKTVTLRFSNCDNAALGAMQTLKIDTNGDGTLDYEQLLLLPCTEDEPRTAIVYAIPSEVRDFGVTSGVGSGTGTGMDTAFGVRWRDFFDIGLAAETSGPLVKQELFEDLRTPFADTLRFNATSSWTVDDIDQYSASENSSVELLRTTGPSWIVVDRLDFEEGGCGAQWEFRDAVSKLHDDPKFRPPDAASADDNYFWDPNNPGFNFFNGIRIKDNDYFT
ncbi:MAG: hypothetical protein KDA22_16060, partial [Phycisphaerales bacterium]|nr:hypothetical protein [Phycisphaerales bacterium]